MNAVLRVEEIVVHNQEPTVLDLRLAELLGFSQSRDIRKLILRSMDELQRYGEVCATVAQTSPSGGRPGNEYHLNEGQALLIAVKSDAKNAPDVREQLIRVFMAWRQGRLSPPVQPFELPDSETKALRMVTEARMIFGRAAAARLWSQLGLPAIPPDPVSTAPADCLDMLLDATVGSLPVRDMLAVALDGEPAAIAMLGDCGLRVEPGYFLVANSHPFILKIFRGSPYAPHYRTLRRLEGVMVGEVAKYGKIVSRGVRVPAFYIDEASIH